MRSLENYFRRRLRKVLPRLAAGIKSPGYPSAGEVRILMYHRVAALGGDRLCIHPEEFARQMDLLLETGGPVAGLSAALFAGAAAGEGGAVVLTFDDGYRDFYDYVFPVLKSRGLPAAVFVVPDFIEGRVELERYRGRGEESRSLTWEMLEEMAAAGVTVGSHSLTHRELPGLNPEEAEREIGASAAAIERRLGRRPEWFAYPRGKFTPALAARVRAAGYRGALTVRPGINRPPCDLYALRRTEISGGDDRGDFARKLQGGFDLYHQIWQVAAGNKL